MTKKFIFITLLQVLLLKSAFAIGDSDYYILVSLGDLKILTTKKLQLQYEKYIITKLIGFNKNNIIKPSITYNDSQHIWEFKTTNNSNTVIHVVFVKNLTTDEFLYNIRELLQKNITNNFANFIYINLSHGSPVGFSYYKKPVNDYLIKYEEVFKNINQVFTNFPYLNYNIPLKDKFKIYIINHSCKGGWFINKAKKFFKLYPNNSYILFLYSSVGQYQDAKINFVLSKEEEITPFYKSSQREIINVQFINAVSYTQLSRITNILIPFVPPMLQERFNILTQRTPKEILVNIFKHLFTNNNIIEQSISFIKSLHNPVKLSLN